MSFRWEIVLSACVYISVLPVPCKGQGGQIGCDNPRKNCSGKRGVDSKGCVEWDGWQFSLGGQPCDIVCKSDFFSYCTTLESECCRKCEEKKACEPKDQEARCKEAGYCYKCPGLPAGVILSPPDSCKNSVVVQSPSSSSGTSSPGGSPSGSSGSSISSSSSGPSPAPQSDRTGIISGASVAGGFVLFFLLIALYVWHTKRRHSQRLAEREGLAGAFNAPQADVIPAASSSAVHGAPINPAPLAMGLQNRPQAYVPEAPSAGAGFAPQMPFAEPSISPNILVSNPSFRPNGTGGGNAPMENGVRPSEDIGLCQVCLEHPRTIKLQPCGHACFCRPCFDLVMQRDRKCIICRTAVLSFTEGLFAETYTRDPRPQAGGGGTAPPSPGPAILPPLLRHANSGLDQMPPALSRNTGSGLNQSPPTAHMWVAINSQAGQSPPMLGPSNLNVGPMMAGAAPHLRI